MGRSSMILVNVLATVFSWLAVILVRITAGSGSETTNFAIFAAFGTTLAIWLVWAF